MENIISLIVEYSVGPIGKQFGYLVFYKSSIVTLEEKFQRVLEKKEAVQQSVNGAQWNQEVVASEVKTWLTNVDKKIEEIQKFLGEDVKANRMCLNGWCPDLKLCYSLGKKAQKNTQAIIQMLEEGEKYDRVYNIAPPLKVRPSSTERFKDFESRKSTIQNVLNALKNDNIDMIALCGMGGMGKTKMAKEIKRRVESDNLFHKVAITVVSQNPNFIKIQGELAESLGTRLEAKSLQGRADELYSILTENKKVLLILDDVWKPLDNEDIEDIGVYYAFKEKSCKILLTSRNEEPCNGIEIQETFRVDLLSEEEAWNLFVEMAGDFVNSSDLISIAKQVAKECAGSPLAIATVGGALSNKSDKNEWKAALQQLKMSIPQNINGLRLKVYSNIEFSYNYLESDEAKSCFLLCCLYPEDYDVRIEDLVRYGVAKRFLEGIGTVEQTRVLVHTIVKNLRRSNLLLDSDEDECIKMHDLVRDVAISIASRDENGFMVVLHRRLEEWPQKDRYDSYTAISLLLGEMKWHPTELKCPKLQLLRLSCLNYSNTFPDNLFDGMKELKMLSLRTSLSTLPPSIMILQNLQMLNLENCELGDVSAIGTLGNLEILSFRDSKINELPSEIGNLSRLKLLDMKECHYLNFIAAGVLSGLSRLEELYMGGPFEDWGCTTAMEGYGEETNDNASLAELIPYSSQLVVLEISVPSILCLPEELDFSNSNFRFMINIGVKDWTNERYLFENTLKLEVEDASDLGEHRTIRSLLKNAVVLNLDITRNLKHIWFEKEEKEILPCSLKDLTISKCEDLENLLEATSDSTPPNTFHLLESLSLEDLPRLIGICNSTDSVEITLTKEEEQNVSETENQAKMLSLFQYNLIESLENLEELSIHRCDSLEVIFELEELNAEESNIFNNLTVLSLIYLPKLLHIWKKDPRDIKGFNYLRLLRVWECGSLKCLFTPSIAKLLVKLEEIEVYSCNEMEEILAKELGDEENRDVIAFPLVKTLKLGNLSKLECFYTEDNHAFEWPSLDKITIVGCPKLKMLASTSTKTPKLKGVHMKFRTFHPMVEGDLNATIQHIIKGEGLNQFSSPPFYDIRSYEAGYDEDVFDF
ncbi:probable disease resistance protein At4g27220 isoform X1 [Juglans microcarpa x Juglans regia]|uniref:probable disease resistance protein At4g27220 isoform X1 n=1 Tax=Juglans microcarpa x Juglans regia TaxID=2249226 RepID=UPI001B7E363F|nr:probable disease resistance protein At4g27220 isoform X1 [Juglans microcarpa x Juglans regia]